MRATTGTGRSAAVSPAGIRRPAKRAHRARSCRDRTRRRPRAAPSSAPARPTARRHRRAADRAARRRRPSSSAAVSGLRKRSRRSTVTLARPTGAPPLRPRQRSACRFRTARPFLAGRATAHPRRQTDRPARGASPAHCATAARMACSARLVACRKAPGRRLDARLAKQEKRRAARDDRLGRCAIAPAQSRQVGALGQRHQRLAPFQRQVEPLVRPQQQVDAAVGLVGDGIGGRTVRQDRRQRHPQRLQKHADEVGRATTQMPTSTMRWLVRSWKPASTRLPCRRNTKSARRRSPGAPTSGGSKRGASTPRCASARLIRSTFQAV